MKKLSTTLALIALFCAGSAYAASPAHSTAARPDREHKRFNIEECDKNKDGALTLEEFKACFPNAKEQRFMKLDENKDGKVTKEEIQAWKQKKQEQGRELRRQTFKKCDTNGDNVLSMEEFEQCKFAPKRNKIKNPEAQAN